MKKVKVISESDTGRNLMFQDIRNHHIMTRKEFVNRINSSSVYARDYYVRKINGVETPVSKPNNSIDDNLE